MEPPVGCQQPSMGDYMEPLTACLCLGLFVLAIPGYQFRIKIGNSGVEFKKDPLSIKQLKEVAKEVINKLLS